VSVFFLSDGRLVFGAPCVYGHAAATARAATPAAATATQTAAAAATGASSCLSHCASSRGGETQWKPDWSHVSASPSSATCTVSCLLRRFAVADTAVRPQVGDASWLHVCDRPTLSTSNKKNALQLERSTTSLLLEPSNVGPFRALQREKQWPYEKKWRCHNWPFSIF